MSDRTEQMDQLAELVSQRLTVDEAAKRAGFSRSHARALWNDIKKGLGWQAR